MAKVIRSPNGTYIRYTKNEWREFWKQDGQGKQKAINKAQYCIVVPCNNEEVALQLSAACNRIFAIPTCHYWNGFEFITYYGDCGHTDEITIRNKLLLTIHQVFTGDYNTMLFGNLFEPESESDPKLIYMGGLATIHTVGELLAVLKNFKLDDSIHMWTPDGFDKIRVMFDITGLDVCFMPDTPAKQ